MQMFTANFLIALREGVEASLLVGILVAYVVRTGRRDVLPKMWLGVFLAAALPMLAGTFMTWGPYTLTFAAQEIIGGTLSLVAVLFVTWMMFWMASNARTISAQLTNHADKALQERSSWAFVWIAVIAVGREGLETAVFVMATVKSGAEQGVLVPLYGVAAGFLLAAVIGWLVYKGASRFNLQLFFSITGFLLIFVAAGILSYGIGDLQEAGVIPGWGTPIYDLTAYFTGGMLSTTSWWFVLAEAMFNFMLAPTHAQFIVWWLYVLIALLLFMAKQSNRNKNSLRRQSPSPTPSATDHAQVNKAHETALPTAATATSTPTMKTSRAFTSA